MRLIILRIVFISFIQVGFVKSLEPFSIAALGGFIAAGYQMLSCSFTECCNHNFITANISGMYKLIYNIDVCYCNYRLRSYFPILRVKVFCGRVKCRYDT